jgi:hypothetical protein
MSLVEVKNISPAPSDPARLTPPELAALAYRSHPEAVREQLRRRAAVLQQLDPDPGAELVIDRVFVTEDGALATTVELTRVGSGSVLEWIDVELELAVLERAGVLARLSAETDRRAA